MKHLLYMMMFCFDLHKSMVHQVTIGVFVMIRQVMLAWWLISYWFLLCFWCCTLTVYGGKSIYICFSIMCGVIVMCGLACSCLCVVTVCLKHEIKFVAGITFIDCSSFSKANTSDCKYASTMNTIEMFWVHSFWFQTSGCQLIVFNFYRYLILSEIIFSFLRLLFVWLDFFVFVIQCTVFNVGSYNVILFFISGLFVRNSVP